jgi:hypothetical protein
LFYAVGERRAAVVADGHEEVCEQSRDTAGDAVGDPLLDEDLGVEVGVSGRAPEMAACPTGSGM